MSKIEEINLHNIEIHELANLTPAMSDEQFESLKESLDDLGQLEPIRMYRGKVVDGRHRVKALRELGSDTVLVQYENPIQSEEEIKMKIIRGWENRRHQSKTQKILMGVKLYNEMRANGVKVTKGEIAKQVGVHPVELSRGFKFIKVCPSQEIIELLFNGGKINIGDDVKSFPTDNLVTLAKYFENIADDILEKSAGTSSQRDFTDDELAMIYGKYEQLKAELGTRMLKKLNEVLFAELKEDDQNHYL